MCLVAFSKTNKYSALKKIDAQRKQQITGPTWAYVVICDNCSHGCSWCYGGFDQDLHQHMLLSDFETILDKLKEVGIQQITLAGGEPTEHPQFQEFVAATFERNFIIHVASHGEYIDEPLARFMASHGVSQVQLNWQGERHHDRVHRRPGSFAKAVTAGKVLLEKSIEVTATVTIGRYNIEHLDEIFTEAAELGVSRLRVWESTGRGNGHRKDLEALEIFTLARGAAAKLGYSHVLSYDPVFEGDVSIPCLQFSGLYMYIASTGWLEFCGAVEERVRYVNCLEPSVTGNHIRQKYLEMNSQLLNGNPAYCPARDGFIEKPTGDLSPTKIELKTID